MKFAVIVHLVGPAGCTTAQLKVGNENLILEAQSVCGALQLLQRRLQDFEINLKHGIKLDGVSIERTE